MVKNLPAKEMRVRPLSQEDHVEEDMATHSSIIVWIIPLSEEPDSPQSMGLQRVGHNWVTNTQSLRKSGVNLCGLDECEVAAMWTVCYSCCLSFKNRAVVTQLKPWACPAPRCPLPGWQHFLPGPRAFLPGLIAHKTWHSAGMHLRAIQGNRLLSASTNNCHRQNAVFTSRHTLSFLGGINTTQKEQGKNPLHLQLSFFPEILIFCCWAKDKSNKYGIDVHTSKRRFRKRCPIQIDYILFYVLLYYACMCAQFCPTLCNPVDCNPTDSSVHGIF